MNLKGTKLDTAEIDAIKELENRGINLYKDSESDRYHPRPTYRAFWTVCQLLYEEKKDHKREYKKIHMQKSILMAVCVILGCLCVILLSFHVNSKSENEISMDRPENGTLFFSMSYKSANPVKFSAHGGKDYYVKIRNKFSNNPNISFYVRNNMSVIVDFPRGINIVTFACGETWYDTERCFGEQTLYSKSAKTFNMLSQPISEINLYPQSNVQLETISINASEF